MSSPSIIKLLPIIPGKKAMPLYPVVKESVVVAKNRLNVVAISINNMIEIENMVRGLVKEKAKIEEGEENGDFEDYEEYSWRLESRNIEESDLNLVTLEVFQKKALKSRILAIKLVLYTSVNKSGWKVNNKIQKTAKTEFVIFPF